MRTHVMQQKVSFAALTSCNATVSITGTCKKMALIFRSPVNVHLKECYEELICENVESPSCYGGYRELCAVLHKYCKASDKILAVGCTCGRQDSLIEDLYDVGYRSVAGVDNSESNICNSRERNKERRPEIEFVVGQVHDLKVRASKLFTPGALTDY